MFAKISFLALTALLPLSSFAAFTGDYVTPNGQNTMRVEAFGGDKFKVTVHKDDENSTCDVAFTLRQDESNPDKLFSKVGDCYVSVLTTNDWANITANGRCETMCEQGSLDTNGFKKR